jgi:hypothetical protein
MLAGIEPPPEGVAVAFAVSVRAGDRTIAATDTITVVGPLADHSASVIPSPTDTPSEDASPSPDVPSDSPAPTGEPAPTPT